MSAVHDVLVKALTLIEDPAKWCGSGWGTGGKRCAMHAINNASGYSVTNRASADRFNGACDALENVTGQSVGPFNDSSNHAEVTAAFRAAIKATA